MVWLDLATFTAPRRPLLLRPTPNIVNPRFEDIFRSHNPQRDKYLSRLFGLFNEEVVRSWCLCPESPYEDLGRPTIREAGEQRGHTLDFTFRRRSDDKVFVGEMKCELEFNGYRYLRLVSADQVRHHTFGPAFQKFLQLAGYPSTLDVRLKGQDIKIDGAILVWGAVEPEGRDSVMDDYGIADVISAEEMLGDMRMWRPGHWREKVEGLRDWSQELFSFLLAE